ncbi:MAG TPA: response regulator [Anaerolineales bacterium]|nr:response regulator [Anaerolineales bacterium]
MTSRESKGDIVIVDDDLSGLRLLSNLLVEHGFSVRSARDGSTALMMIAADPPDLILLDILMPGMDGFQVCEQLKASPSSRDIPVLFISAQDDVNLKIKAFTVGGVDYINRPYKIEEVLARIKTHLTISQLHAALSQRLSELSALHEISKVFTTSQVLPQALEVICKMITGLFGVRLSFIALQENDSFELKGLIGFERKSGTISLSRAESVLVDMSIFPKLKNDEKSTRLTNLQSLTLPENVHEFIRNNNLQSCLIAPLISKGVSLGLLILAKDEHGISFDQMEIELAETIASDIAAAIENDRLTEKARIAAVGEERKRLSRELHDSVTQLIYSLTLQSSGWESMARQGTLEDPADSFRRLGALGQQALREMRLLLHQLRHTTLEEKGLVKTLQLRLDAVERRANIDSMLVIQGNLKALPHKIENELFYIAQEALNNSLRHANAEAVKVLIVEDQGMITLSVEDNGIGFDVPANHSGMGLTNMLERAQAIAGELSIQSEETHGTRVTLSVKIDQE